jgi:CubicO group peptidase (beta-lactamase class C family)
MGGGRLSKARLDRMREVMAGHVERGLPGLVTLISRRGETHVEAIGMRAAGGPGAAGNGLMRRDTIFRIASMSKPVIAAATMILVEECKLRLDDPVDRLLPELANRKVLRRLDGPLDDTEPARRSITVRDLLTFRLGLGMIMAPPNSMPIQKALAERGLGQGPPAPGATVAPDEWMRRLGTLPLMHQPGERWMYHTGSDVLGVLIARAVDRPLEAFLRERVFEPLGMKDTGFSVPAGKLDRLATSYLSNPGTGALELYDAAEGGQWSRPPAFPSGGGGMVSTVDDFLAFARMLQGGGKQADVRILSRLSVEVMTTDQLTPEQKAASDLGAGFFDRYGWGFGMAVVTRRDGVATVPGQYGWDGGLGTSWRSDPKEEMVGILMTQRAWESPVPPPVTSDFWTGAYQAIDD